MDWLADGLARGRAMRFWLAGHFAERQGTFGMQSKSTWWDKSSTRRRAISLSCQNIVPGWQVVFPTARIIYAMNGNSAWPAGCSSRGRAAGHEG